MATSYSRHHCPSVLSNRTYFRCCKGRRRSHSRTERACRSAGHTCIPTCPLFRIWQASCRPTSPSGCCSWNSSSMSSKKQDEHGSARYSVENIHTRCWRGDFCSWNYSRLILCMGVVCLASDGGPSILPRLALSSCVLRSWLILIIAVKQHQCLGLCRITAQSSTEARGKIACCPRDRPDNMVQQLAGVNQHHVSCGCAIDRPSKTLDERCFISFSQTPELVDERRKCMNQFVLEDICHLHATLLTDDQ